MASNKGQDGILIIGIVILVLVLLPYLNINLFSVLPETTQNYMLSGNIIEVTTAFGSYVNSPGQEFCGSNDRDVQASNNVEQQGDDLYLKTSMSISKRICEGINEIKAKTTLPAGTLTIQYDLNSNQNDHVKNSYSSISISSESGTLFSEYSSHNVKCNGGDIRPEFCKPSVSGTTAIYLNQSTELDILLTSDGGYVGSADASTTLSFEEKIIETEENVTTENNETIICPEEFDYNATTEKCEKYPGQDIICLEGTYNSYTKKCEVNPTIERFEIGKTLNLVMFNINDFEIKLWMLLVGGAVLIILLSRKK